MCSFKKELGKPATQVCVVHHLGSATDSFLIIANYKNDANYYFFRSLEIVFCDTPKRSAIAVWLKPSLRSCFATCFLSSGDPWNEVTLCSL